MHSTSERLAAICEQAGKLADEAKENPEIKARLERLAKDAEEAERSETQRHAENQWRARGIPERLWPMLHASASGSELGPQATTALDATGRFLSPQTRATFLVLAGGVGVGKTVAAAWGCAFHGGTMVKAIDLVRAGLFPEDHGFWPSMQKARLLAIDDLGSEPLDTRGYGHVAVADLLDRRYDAARKTIITTNLALEQFRMRYGDGAGRRLWDRIREVGWFIEVPGGSLRKEIA